MGDYSSHRRISVHKSLGGGSVADVLLWRNWPGAVVVLASATALWYIFERGRYNFLSFSANVLFLLVVILFLWAKSASLLNRPLPPLPDLMISEQSVLRIANVLQLRINNALSIAHDIAVGRSFKLLVEVVISLWLISYIGSICISFTILYIGTLLIFTAPAIYERHQDSIDEKLYVTLRVIETQYRKIDDSILKKILLSSTKQKKTE